MGSYSSTLVASGKLRLTLRGPRCRGRYLPVPGLAQEGPGWRFIVKV